MIVELISIGDELLIGQTVNTNASWLGEEFSKRGAIVECIHTISDHAPSIRQTLKTALKTAQMVIITGGLGPTKDDITKQVIADYFQDEFVIDAPTLQRVKDFFSRRDLPFLEVNREQALVPKSSIVLTNIEGTAPGIWIERDQKVVICLPGVPYEMRSIMLNEGFPRIEEKWKLSVYYSKTANLQGIGESYVADIMKDWEEDLRREGLELAYLPSTGIVRLRISSKRGKADAQRIDEYMTTLQNRLSTNFYGYGDITLSEVLAEWLTKNKRTVGTAESCTAGALAAELVSVPGASAYFCGGLLCYSNELKHTLLNVHLQDIEKYGAVSEQVVKAMAIGGRERLSVDYCIATSGIAGPTGASEQKEIGTTWIAVASKEKVLAKKFIFEQNRSRNIRRTVLSALNLLRNFVEDA